MYELGPSNDYGSLGCKNMRWDLNRTNNFHWATRDTNRQNHVTNYVATVVTLSFDTVVPKEKNINGGHDGCAAASRSNKPFPVENNRNLEMSVCVHENFYWTPSVYNVAFTHPLFQNIFGKIPDWPPPVPVQLNFKHLSLHPQPIHHPCHTFPLSLICGKQITTKVFFFSCSDISKWRWRQIIWILMT